MKHKMAILILLISFIIISLFFVGCVKNNERTNQIENKYKCSADSDCAVINTDCGDCNCNLEAVNKEYVKVRNKECENYSGLACDTVCLIPVLKCINGKCTMQ